eukprot:CAMPEP_0182584150 /NCGR_PEP_ID=MMETSP1324-20130603/57028_1 /TAXON_ID=236786 /ORGANISM="Florenciella sp., Strain RCC1587" /LENGTH=46 /DNA_ID= /DNA_START= /DNA_END= /DNA_ORIENTATION=
MGWDGMGWDAKSKENDALYVPTLGPLVAVASKGGCKWGKYHSPQPS